MSTVTWFDAHASAAPAHLVSHARRYLDRVPADDAARMDGPLAAAGGVALEAAIAAGAGRAAALDLLAADALVTMALLATATTEPEQLGARARALRVAATADGSTP